MTQKKSSLQALRAIAFIFIFLMHAVAGVSWGHFGVAIFFCLSGFLLIYNGYDKELTTGIAKNFKYAVNKIKKLYSLHIITMLLVLMIPLSRLLLKGDAGQDMRTVLTALGLNIILMQTWWPAMEVSVALNGVAWFLSVSLFLYFCFPWIKRIIKKINNEVVLIVISFFILLLQIGLSALVLKFTNSTNGTWVWATYFFPLFRLGDFIIGCNLGVWYRNHLKDKKVNTLLATVLEVFALLVTVVYEIWQKGISTDNMWINSLTNWTTVYIVLAIVWILLFAGNNGALTHVLNNKVLVWLGDISAYTFLIHYMVIQCLSNILNYFDVELVSWQQAVFVLIEFIVTIILSYGWDKAVKKRVIS